MLKPIVPDPGTCICVLTDTTGNYFTPRVRLGGRLRTDSVRMARLQREIRQRLAGAITIFGLITLADE